MRNFEYWEKEVLELTEKDKLALKNGKPVQCRGLSCSRCEFHRYNEENCENIKIKWLYEEHIERPTLTKKERMFCKLVETGWIARDKNWEIYWNIDKPVKGSIGWVMQNMNKVSSLMKFDCSFNFIRWEDAEPWSVEDLLKLDVKE